MIVPCSRRPDHDMVDRMVTWRAAAVKKKEQTQHTAKFFPHVQAQKTKVEPGLCLKFTNANGCY